MRVCLVVQIWKIPFLVLGCQTRTDIIEGGIRLLYLSATRTVQVQTKGRRRGESISKSAFRVKYLRRSRKLWNRYLNSKPWVNQLYESFLDIRPGQRVVDVGCGPGDFTRYLARLSDGKSKILGIDSNPKSIKAGISDTKKAHLSQVVSYKLGDVYKI